MEFPLNTVDQEKIESVIALCREARKRLDPDDSIRLRVLLDMALLELGRELARRNGTKVA